MNAARRLEAPLPAASTVISACRCGARYTGPAFDALPVVRVLDVEEIAPLVIRWPSGVAIDVRACTSCKTPLARLKREP